MTTFAINGNTSLLLTVNIDVSLLTDIFYQGGWIFSAFHISSSILHDLHKLLSDYKIPHVGAPLY